MAIKVKCEHCNGSGYQSAASKMPADTPSALMPVGVWPCPHCINGYRLEMDDKEIEAALDVLLRSGL